MLVVQPFILQGMLNLPWNEYRNNLSNVSGHYLLKSFKESIALMIQRAEAHQNALLTNTSNIALVLIIGWVVQSLVLVYAMLRIVGNSKKIHKLSLSTNNHLDNNIRIQHEQNNIRDRPQRDLPPPYRQNCNANRRLAEPV